MADDTLASWLAGILGEAPRDLAIFRRALTHGSHDAAENYERLEFLGDHVLGLAIAEWVYRLFPDEPEGKLARRLHVLVSGESCAAVARALGLAAHLRMGKQARDDGAMDSDYVLGDAMEGLIGAVYLELGLEAARRLIARGWGEMVNGQTRAPQHPKSALQEWTAEKRLKPPAYALVRRSGPHHQPTFAVSVAVTGRSPIEAEGASKQEAETAAALAMLREVAGW